jgi:chromosome segregation ATPase
MESKDIAPRNNAITKFKPNKLGLKIILGGKFKEKMSIIDIKSHIYNEMKENTKLQEENHQLQDRLCEIDEWKEKYEITCSTIEEYKNRIDTKEQEIKHYQNNIKSIKDDNRLLKSEIVDKDNEIKELKKIIKQMEKDKEINSKTTKKKGNK